MATCFGSAWENTNNFPALNIGFAGILNSLIAFMRRPPEGMRITDVFVPWVYNKHEIMIWEQLTGSRPKT